MSRRGDDHSDPLQWCDSRRPSGLCMYPSRTPYWDGRWNGRNRILNLRMNDPSSGRILLPKLQVLFVPTSMPLIQPVVRSGATNSPSLIRIKGSTILRGFNAGIPTTHYHLCDKTVQRIESTKITFLWWTGFEICETSRLGIKILDAPPNANPLMVAVAVIAETCLQHHPIMQAVGVVLWEFGKAARTQTPVQTAQESCQVYGAVGMVSWSDCVLFHPVDGHPQTGGRAKRTAW